MLIVGLLTLGLTDAVTSEFCLCTLLPSGWDGHEEIRARITCVSDELLIRFRSSNIGFSVFLPH